MNWTHTRVLVTGAAGFIGSHLTERLVELGATTRALVRYSSLGSWGWLDHSPVKSSIEVVAGDVRDAGTLKAAVAGVDVVFHLASLVAIPYSYSAPLSYVRTNIEGTLNLCEAALAASVRRLVHTSTSEVYGTAQYVPIDERHPQRGQSPYSATKIGADQMVEAFHRSFGLPAVTIRPFNTYGPRQSARAVIPTIITQALTGGHVKLGSTSPTRDFTFVADTVEAFVKIAECTGLDGQVLNVGNGKDIAIGDLVTTIQDLLGRPLNVVSEHERVRPQASEVERLCADSSLVRRLTGWQPIWDLGRGLSATISWIEKHLDRYRIGTYTR